MRHDFWRLGGRTSLALILSLWLGPTAARAADWPQWMGAKRDGIWRENGILEKFPAGGPKVLWRKPLGSGYTGPSVANGRVYVMDRYPPLGLDGKVLPENKGKPVIERVLCLDEKSGQTVWKHEYEGNYDAVYWKSGPRTTPLVEGDRLYTLGSSGVLCCLSTAKGEVHWQKDINKEYKAPMPVWGYAAHPLILGDTLYTLAGGEGSAVVALNKKDGTERWRKLTSKEVCYAPPTLAEVDGHRHLLIWLSESLNGLDPETGRVLWTEPYPENGKPDRPAVNIITPKQIGDLVFVSNGYHGGLVVKLKGDTAKVVWREKGGAGDMKKGARMLMSTPVYRDGFLYGLGNFGDLRCIRLSDGKVEWQTNDIFKGEDEALFAGLFMTSNGDRDFMLNDKGELIIARLTPKGYEEIDRTPLIKPIEFDQRTKRTVVWVQPAYANRCVFVRNDREILCASLAADPAKK
jgi:outer membrane protein assembly factor BamB